MYHKNSPDELAAQVTEPLD